MTSLYMFIINLVTTCFVYDKQPAKSSMTLIKLCDIDLTFKGKKKSKGLGGGGDKLRGRI